MRQPPPSQALVVYVGPGTPTPYVGVSRDAPTVYMGPGTPPLCTWVPGTPPRCTWAPGPPNVYMGSGTSPPVYMGPRTPPTVYMGPGTYPLCTRDSRDTPLCTWVPGRDGGVGVAVVDILQRTKPSLKDTTLASVCRPREPPPEARDERVGREKK